MTRIKTECLANAAGMLDGPHSTPLGSIGDVRFYLVDGVVWSRDQWNDVARCDDPGESETVRRAVRHFNEMEDV